MAKRPNYTRYWRRLKRAPGRVIDWLVNVGWRVVAPFESLVTWLLKKIYALSEDVFGFETLAAYVAKAVLWPVRVLGHVLWQPIQYLIPKSWLRGESGPLAPLNRLGTRLLQGFVRLAEFLNL